MTTGLNSGEPFTKAVAPPLRTAEVRWTNTSPVPALHKDLGSDPLELLILYVTPLADFDGVVAEAARLFPDSQVMACTTAGEIGQAGYEEGLIVAVGFPKMDFACATLMIPDLDQYDAQDTIDQIAVDRVRLCNANPALKDSFAFLVVDGLSRREDLLTATIAPALRETPLFGASAGDGLNFLETRVALNGIVRQNAAVLVQMRSKYRMVVFSHDHFKPTDIRMVVTEADPEKRLVKTINAEPAGREYARIVGIDPEQLDRFTFASHPVVVRIGGEHHVRAIRQVNEKGELLFFSAIDEGMVLTVARSQDMVQNLESMLDNLSNPQRPASILTCDCLLRRIEAERGQATTALSDVMSRNNIVGFSTYGEQIGALHVNQTMTGVAIYTDEP